MLGSTEYREFRNGKRYYKSIEREMGDHGNTEENGTEFSSENVKKKFPRFRRWHRRLSTNKLEGLMLL